MECDICLEEFDLVERRPKTLPCGHSVCRHCSHRMHKQVCPACRKEFSTPVLSLPDNYAVLELIEKKQRLSPGGSSIPLSKMRCRDCSTVASAKCVDRGHVLLSPGKKRPKTIVRSGLPSGVQTTAEQAERVVEMLQGAAQAVESQLVEWRASLKQVQESERALRHAVEHGTLEEIDELCANLDLEQLDRLKEAAGLVEASCGLQAQLQDKLGDKWKELKKGDPVELLNALVLDIHQQGSNENSENRKEPVPRKAKPSVPAVGGRIQELDLHNLSQTAPSKRTEKINVLARLRQRGVRRLIKVRCDRDPAWILVVLRSAAPTLEELYMKSPCAEHVREAHAMAGLRRLELECDGYLDARPPVLPDLPQASLKWLRAVGLPRPTLVSLLRAHSASLDDLWLQVGTPGGGKWPWACNDLEALLVQSGLHSSRIVLVRLYVTHSTADCPAQVAAVRAALGSTVQCTECHKVKWERF
ncbi:uncharacterized protein LOC117644848 [Thrips palmi]|uniref:Uncharacterized protein LOC117644848 n=1 Tax=Thrips palmi TaxID=161013 RepID=A0A6P8ZMC9_THRPL|nr:uncharacterized protein LOC117644848 [Thrips palmi]